MRLIRTTDRDPGLSRRRRGRGFSYHLPDGSLLRDPAERKRIDALAVPPAYEDVWICPLSHGHLQATGRDAAKRKQYRYHPEWRKKRNANLFGSLVAFAAALPRLRRRITDDLSRDDLDRKRVLAAAAHLLQLSLVRAGHGGVTGGRKTYGLATLRGRHVSVNADGIIELAFRGKSGQRQTRTLESHRLAAALRESLSLDADAVLAYEDASGTAHTLTADAINDYLREAMGDQADDDAEGFTAKHFRTWGGTVYAAATLARAPRGQTAAERKRQTVAAVKAAAAALGNRPATCRKHYVAPAVFAAFENDTLHAAMNERPDPDRTPPRRGLGAEERAVKKLLERAGGAK